MTPMQQQYKEIKEQYPEDIVLFRLGDFYETFYEDAKLVAHLAGITLTGRGKEDKRVPMAGIPYHALDNYLPKLLSENHKVVLVDQIGEVETGKLVERGVTRVYTPGTLTEEKILKDNANNYIASLSVIKSNFGLALADISTGKLLVMSTSDKTILVRELYRFSPVEIIVSEAIKEAGVDLPGVRINVREALGEAKAQEVLHQHFGVKSTKGFGFAQGTPEFSALADLILYLKECQRSELTHLKNPSIHNPERYMPLDPSTIRNLELLHSNNGDDSTTLFSVLNQCSTNMGSRLLRNWLIYPSIEESVINDRLDVVAFFHEDMIKTGSVQKVLQEISDIERLSSRLGVGSINPRELVAIKDSINATHSLSLQLEQEQMPEHLRLLYDHLAVTEWKEELVNTIQEAISDSPPVSINEGGIIATGYNSEVDSLRELKNNSKGALAAIQASEAATTGITSLKIGYNRVFGYYIEVSHAHSAKVPDSYIRKQTLANAERYITEELKELEEKILSAEERLVTLEQELFNEVKDKVSNYLDKLLELSAAVAELDVLVNFANLGRQYEYCRPEVYKAEASRRSRLVGIALRHPVIERHRPTFTPNDINLEDNSNVVILTGPNMSGKSTYIRQVALSVLMAQCGSFVPASSLKFTIYDKVFTRVGASDNLSKGESTFMVEMTETANILNNATKHSLVILDEVGRGTSTYDGVAIAWAIVEHIAEKINCSTLFATHYHELTSLSDKYPSVKNYQVEVKESGKEVIFTHNIVNGATSKSYGVNVAEMAGVPKEVTERASSILSGFESQSKQKQKRPSSKGINPEQLEIFS